MAELRELFEKTVEKLRMAEDPEEIIEILSKFEAELPEGEVKEFFFNLGNNMENLPSEAETDAMGDEEFKGFLDQIREQVKTELGNAPQEIPREIIKAYEKMLDFFVLQLKILFDIEDGEGLF